MRITIRRSNFHFPAPAECQESHRCQPQIAARAKLKLLRSHEEQHHRSKSKAQRNPAENSRQAPPPCGSQHQSPEQQRTRDKPRGAGTHLVLADVRIVRPANERSATPEPFAERQRSEKRIDRRRPAGNGAAPEFKRRERQRRHARQHGQHQSRRRRKEAAADHVLGSPLLHQFFGGAM